MNKGGTIIFPAYNGIYDGYQTGINPDFIYSRIFKNNDGASVASMLGDPRKNIQSAFNDIIKNPMSVLKTIRRLMNFSPIRQGINQDDQTAMDIYQLFAASAADVPDPGAKLPVASGAYRL